MRLCPRFGESLSEGELRLPLHFPKRITKLHCPFSRLTVAMKNTKNTILARRATHNVPESVLWGIQVVTKQAEALRALPASATQAKRREAMKAVRASLTA